MREVSFFLAVTYLLATGSGAALFDVGAGAADNELAIGAFLFGLLSGATLAVVTLFRFFQRGRS